MKHIRELKFKASQLTRGLKCVKIMLGLSIGLMDYEII